MSSTAHTRQGKNHSGSSETKAAESIQKAAYGAQGVARLPAWTSVWGDRPAIGLISPTDLQAKGVLSQPGDPYEREADQVAKQVMHLTVPGSFPMAPPPAPPEASSSLANAVSHVSPMIQRAPADGEATSTPAVDTSTPETAPAAEGAATGPVPEDAAGQAPTPGLIVEDSVEQLQAGQMKKSDFLAQLRAAVCTTTEEALRGTIWSAAGCPWVDHWFGYYSNRDSQQIERALRRYAPETANATSASDYIPIICERVRHAITVWSTTGEITGVPEGVELPGAGLMGAIGSIASGVASAGSSIVSGVESVASGIASAGTSLIRGVGSALSGIGRLLFKSKEGGAREAGNPQAIQGQLGSGSALDSRVKAPMEQAFGVNFSHVRVHTDASAAGLSESLNARAFTVGRDIAFGPGEYRPGTLVGDALIAHELAHVVQQGGVYSSAEPIRQGGAEYEALEADADSSAVGTVVSLWSGAKGGLADVARNAMPAMRSGLRLQRCPGAPKQPTTIAGSKTAGPPVARGEQIPDWTAKVKAANDAEAQADLVRLALGKSITVSVAGTSDTEVANPTDYQPFPVVNFDINLNNKRAWSNKPKNIQNKSTRSLDPNFGYSFRGRGPTRYLVLGPKALDPKSPDFTRRAYEHELYLHEHGYLQGATSAVIDANQELDTWIHDFINYFHLLQPLGASWTMPIAYYEDAESDPRRAALNQLIDYYKDPRAKNPLIPQDQGEQVKDHFAIWFSKRLYDRSTPLANKGNTTAVKDMQLVQDLNTALGEDINNRLKSYKERR